jgi:cobalt-zinc-cadmium efflux system outer membrane protein
MALGLGVVLAVHSTYAAEPGALRVTLDEALAMMRRQNPEVLAEALKVSAAGGDTQTARLLPNPTLSASVGNLPLGRTNPPGLSADHTIVSQVALAEELQLWGRRRARIEAALGRQAEVAAERADLDRQLAFAVRTAFTALALADERVRLGHQTLDEYRETVRVSEARAHNGEISPAEHDKIQLEQRTVEHELDDADLARRQAVATLVPLLGTDAVDVEAVGQPPLPPVPDDAEPLVAEALARRPDLVAATRTIDATEAALRQARAERWPDPTVGVAYGHSEFTVSGDLRNQIGATLSLPLPVFDRNQGVIQRAAAEAMIAHHEADKLRLTIPQEVRTALKTYAVARARVRRFEDQFLAQSREARHAAEVAYREGTVGLLEFLEAERTYIQTARDHLDALLDAHTANFDLTRAAALEVSAP